MGNISKLAGQTFWYGFSSIIGRFINYLLTPLLTGIYASERYGDISILFAYAAFLNIIFTFGMETSYFRFSKEAMAILFDEVDGWEMIKNEYSLPAIIMPHTNLVHGDAWNFISEAWLHVECLARKI